MIYIVWTDIWPCLWISLHQCGTLQLSLKGHQIRPGELGIKVYRKKDHHRGITHDSHTRDQKVSSRGLSSVRLL